MKYSNKHNLPLAMAVFLANDEYEYSDEPKTISVTTLLGSVRSIILSGRIPPSDNVVDVSTLLASKLGTCLHNGLEQAWRSPKLPEILKSLNIPKRAIERIRIDPVEHDPDMLNIYLERRVKKDIAGWTISGQNDMTIDGTVYDLKSTSTFKWNKESPEYTQQMSIYRWLDPETITEDDGKILFWFKDWNQNIAYSTRDYPSQPIMEKSFRLMSLQVTERFITDKLALLDQHIESPMIDLPECTPEELWQKPPAYQYFSKPDGKRSSKNFDNSYEAQMHLNAKGKGVIKLKHSEPTKCKYCSAVHTCNQAQKYIDQGILRIS